MGRDDFHMMKLLRKEYTNKKRKFKEVGYNEFEMRNLPLLKLIHPNMKLARRKLEVKKMWNSGLDSADLQLPEVADESEEEYDDSDNDDISNYDQDDDDDDVEVVNDVRAHDRVPDPSKVINLIDVSDDEAEDEDDFDDFPLTPILNSDDDDDHDDDDDCEDDHDENEDDEDEEIYNDGDIELSCSDVESENDDEDGDDDEDGSDVEDDDDDLVCVIGEVFAHDRQPKPHEIIDLS